MFNLILAAIAGLICFIASTFLLNKAIKKKEIWKYPLTFKQTREPFLFWSVFSLYVFAALAGLIILALSIMMINSDN